MMNEHSASAADRARLRTHGLPVGPDGQISPVDWDGLADVAACGCSEAATVATYVATIGEERSLADDVVVWCATAGKVLATCADLLAYPARGDHAAVLIAQFDAGRIVAERCADSCAAVSEPDESVVNCSDACRQAASLCQAVLAQLTVADA